MIVANIKDAKRYYGVMPEFKEIFEKLSALTPDSPTGGTEYDGFRIAEKDLLLRGPGDFIKGSSDPVIRQSGGLKFRLADMSEDSGVLSEAYEAARELIEESPDLANNDNLRMMIAKMFSIDEYSLN